MTVLDEICADLRIGKDAAARALRELEIAGFISNLTPELSPLASSWRITALPFNGQPATRDYERPEAIEGLKRSRAEQRAAYRRNRK